MKKLVAVIVIAIALISAGSSAFAHSGGTDAWGGHYVRTPGPGRIVGTYHLH